MHHDYTTCPNCGKEGMYTPVPFAMPKASKSIVFSGKKCRHCGFLSEDYKEQWFDWKTKERTDKFVAKRS